MKFKRTLIAACILILTTVVMQYLGHVGDIPIKKPFSTFPAQMGEWGGKEEHFDQQVYDVLGVDDSFLGTYRKSGSKWVQLYVGFYRSQREGELIHSPKNCLPGAGWKIVGSSLEELNLKNHNPGRIKVIKLRIQRGAERQLVLYWFQSRGRFIASEYWQKIYLVIDSILRHRTDGSFVRLIAPISEDGEEKALETLKEFTSELLPVLEEYLPS